MGIIKKVGPFTFEETQLNKDEIKKASASDYKPTEDEQDIRKMIIQHMLLGYQTMYKPRREFNDLSVIGRSQVDQMSFNTYQPNNGEAPEGDIVEGWRSNAIRPIVRNKCVSMCGHATSRLIFPKVFAYNDQSETQEEAAIVMRELMEWAGEQCDYTKSSFQAIWTAFFSPASILYTEYCETFRNVKEEKKDGKWIVKKILDEENSGFQDRIVPIDELYIENIYEHDIQKQGWLIWRKVISYDTARIKYDKYDNWKYVKPGVQIIYNDVNQTFYESYDFNLRTDLVEEIQYWNKSLDSYIVMVNGVVITDYDNPNPRQDKQYPFVKFGYEWIDEGKFFYYKSLAFKLQSDANIINTLYPMFIDGTYLDMFSPVAVYGSETIGSDIWVPGSSVVLQDPNSRVTPIKQPTNIAGPLRVLEIVNESLNESSQDPITEGKQTTGNKTAYEISRLEQNASTVLGVFLKMIGFFVKSYGKLRLSDIIQYLTIVDVDKITDDSKLVFKSFLIPSEGKYTTKKISFQEMPEQMTEEEQLKRSFEVLSYQEKKGQELAIVNPKLFRNLKYMLMITPDVLNPRSDELERAMGLEAFDKSIEAAQAGVQVDLEKAYKDFVLENVSTVKDNAEYIKEGPSPEEMMQQQLQQPKEEEIVSPLSKVESLVPQLKK